MGQELWDAGLSDKTLQRDGRKPRDGHQKLFQERVRDLLCHLR